MDRTKNRKDEGMKDIRLSEAAFETAIEAHLLKNGYASVARERFDRERAVFSEVVLDFIRETQPDQRAKLEALHGDKTGEQILSDLCKWMDPNGCLSTLRVALIAAVLTGQTDVGGDP